MLLLVMMIGRKFKVDERISTCKIISIGLSCLQIKVKAIIEILPSFNLEKLLHIFMIEFQKRGRHSHILDILLKKIIKKC